MTEQHPDHAVVDLPELDEPPKGDYWAPEIADVEATDDEITEGNRLGDQTREGAAPWPS